MGEDLASANVNRTYSLAATCIAIFTFMLFFLYPRYEGGKIDPRLFQGMLVVMGVATFSFVFATFHFYCASSGGRFDEVERARLMRRGDRLWLLGYLLLFLVPCLILFLIKMFTVAWAWLALWLVFLLYILRAFPRLHR